MTPGTGSDSFNEEESVIWQKKWGLAWVCNNGQDDCRVDKWGAVSGQVKNECWGYSIPHSKNSYKLKNRME